MKRATKPPKQNLTLDRCADNNPEDEIVATSEQDGNKNLKLGLFILRITTGIFFLAWAIEKLFNPGHAVAISKKFYGLEISPEITLAIGVAQIAITILFMLGLYKKWTTGFLLAIHTVAVASTWQKLIFAYTAKGLLFWAAVPVLAGLLLLFLARSDDTMCSIHKK